MEDEKIPLHKFCFLLAVQDIEQLFFFEAELASKTILQEKTEAAYPAMTWEDTLGNLKVLDDWRKIIGYSLPQDIN